jgi:hypothetical protein
MANMSLKNFFLDLNIPEGTVEGYASGLLSMGIHNNEEFTKVVNVWSLEQIGVPPSDIVRIMQKIFTPAGEPIFKPQPQENFLIDTTGIQSVPHSLYDTASPYVRRLTRDSVIVLEEIGHGASGHVSKALFVPTLTFLAIKRIEIKEAITRKVVGQELKFLYEVARYY